MKSIFFRSEDTSFESVDQGVNRKILGYDQNIMMVQVDFEKDATGALHRHPHAQSTYVLSGIFDVTIEGETKVLKEGDCFVVPGNCLHGVYCKQKGSLIDAFSPAREDFLKTGK